MHVDRFEKMWIGVSMLLIIALIATVTYGAVGVGINMVDDSGGQVDPNSLGDHPKFGDPGVEQVGENHYAVYVVSQQFMFDPGTNEPIRVPADSTVTFHITTSDVVHGFAVPGTNINTMVIPGQVAKVTVRFDEPGEYGIVCHEYCGSGHHTMEGQIVVVPADEYGGNN